MKIFHERSLPWCRSKSFRSRAAGLVYRIEALFSGRTHRAIRTRTALEAWRGIEVTLRDILRNPTNSFLRHIQLLLSARGDHFLIGLKVVKNQPLGMQFP